MALAHSPKIVTNGLMLHLDAANPKSYPGSGSTWYDLSGYSRHATLFSNVVYNSEAFGCLDFNRTDDSYATIAHDDQIATEVFGASTTFTLGGWFVIDEYFDYATLLQKSGSGSYSNSTNGIWMESPNEIVGICGSSVGGNPAGSERRAYFNATPGQWYNVVWAGNGTTARLYVNSVYINSINFSDITVTRIVNSNSITIGRRSMLNTPELDGRIAVVTAYNRGLTEVEIRQNFNAYRGRFGL